MHVPSVITRVAEACREAGGRAWVVGGSVRDDLLGRPVKDHDVEVHGLPPDALAAVLRRLGRVDEVGRSFGVFKLSAGGRTLDISLPRRDSNAGPGHRGIHVEGDPFMGPAEAARRRDLTINAIMLDPLTGELLDPHGGREDLARRRLRAVDPHTFLDDPLRALRVVQFAGRFEMEPDDELVALCRRAPLDELPAERVLGELEKLLLGAARPSLGLALARRAQILQRILPEVAGVPAPRLDPAIDRAAALRTEAGAAPRPLALMLATLLHANTRDEAERSLDRLRVHSRLRYPLRDRVLGGVALHGLLVGEPGDEALRRLAETEEIALLVLVAEAASGSPAPRRALLRATLLGVDRAPLPTLVQGRDLAALGLPPGPAMGAMLAALRDTQLQGRVETREDALDLARRLLADAPERGRP